MIKKYSLLLAVAFLLQVGLIWSQQDPMYSLYIHDKALINPGYVGSSNWMIGSLKYRTQFIGVPGAPTTATFNFHTPIQKKNIGVGIKVIQDKIAVVKTTSAMGAFSYHLGLGGGKLSLGLEAGLLSQRINFDELVKKDAVDNSLSTTAQSKSVFDAAFGMYYKKKNFSIGASETHLPNSKLNFGPDPSSNSHLYSHYFLFAAYSISISDKFYLEPSILLKKVHGAPAQTDLNMTLYYLERFSVGVSYRTGDAICGIFKIGITDQLKVAYSYDHTISSLSSYSGGGHEIMLSYGIKLLPPPAEKEIHPRFYF